jgi:predicted RNase H-like nuclease (RuvC/YqgF family)
MKDLKQAAGPEIALEDLVTMVERAARTIENLQAEVRQQRARITELEQIAAAMEKDAEWAGWFRRKYGNAIYYSVIEKAYLDDHRNKEEKKESAEDACAPQPT